MITGARRIRDLIRNRAEGDSAKSQMLLRHYAMERLLETRSRTPKLPISRFHEEMPVQSHWDNLSQYYFAFVHSKMMFANSARDSLHPDSSQNDTMLVMPEAVNSSP